MYRSLLFQLPQTHLTPSISPDKIEIKHQSRHRLKAARRRKAKWTKQLQRLCDDNFFDTQITRAEDECTDMAKAHQVDPRRRAVDQAHHRRRDAPSFVQHGVNAGYRIGTAFRRAIQRLKTNERRVRFAPLPKVATFSSSENATLVTYDSGADGHYLSEIDRKQPI